jgi:hypothetical protein
MKSGLEYSKSRGRLEIEENVRNETFVMEKVC